MLRIREHRKAKGLNGAELADMLGISESYLSQIERGANGKKPSATLLGKIADALQMEPGELFAPRGFAEPEVAALDVDAPEIDEARQWPGTSAAFKAAAGHPDLGIVCGDLLAVRLGGDISDGDVAVINRVDAQSGQAVTLLRRAHRVGNRVAVAWSDRDGVHIELLQDGDAIIGVVVGLLRNLRH